jgi:hypothetical protein
MDDPEVVVLGDRDLLPTIGRTVPKRPAIVAIAERYVMATMIDGDSRNQMPVYLTPGGALRVRHYAWQDGRACEVLPDPKRRMPPMLRDGDEPAVSRRVTVVRNPQPRRLPRSKR